jgi:hypothetical protein
MLSRPVWLAAVAAIALLWLGMIVGVSFIATPVKFAAASLTRPVAFDVGGVTFALFSRIEWGMCLVFGLAMLAGRPDVRRLVVLAFIVAIVVLQGAWLLPELNIRAAAVMEGKPLPPSIHHGVFAAVEVLKSLLLAGLAVANLWSLACRNRAFSAR